MIFCEMVYVLGQVILFSTCPLGQVDLKTSVKPCYVQKQDPDYCYTLVWQPCPTQVDV